MFVCCLTQSGLGKKSSAEMETDMKKQLEFIVTVCMLVVAVGFGIFAGPQFAKALSGPETLKTGEEFGQAEGKYLSYEAFYPVASYVEEYYKGDASRIKTTRYIVYDEERQAFLCIVAPERKSGDLKELMWNLHLMAELRKTKDMSPAVIEGTLEPMDSDIVQNVVAAVKESEIFGIYKDFGDGSSEAYYEAYYGDEYGKVMEKMCKAVSEGWKQSEWYYIEYGSIHGFSNSWLWLSIIVAGLSLLIFIFRLIKHLSSGKTKAEGEISTSESVFERFLNAQKNWIEIWCENMINRAHKTAYITVAASVIIMVAIGFFSGTTAKGIVAFYLAIGLLFGELMALMVNSLQKKLSNPRKILKKLGKHIKKELPAVQDQEMFAEDYFNAGKDWWFEERRKDSLICGFVGSSYWAAFTGIGTTTIIDVNLLEKVQTEMESGEIRSGKARVRYVYYIAKFFCKNSGSKKSQEKRVVFETESGRDRLMVLVRKRVDEGVELLEE